LLLGFSGAFRRFGRPTNLALIGQYAAAEFVTEAPESRRRHCRRL
jgi:hypothetical protein